MASRSLTRLINGAALTFGKKFLKDVERSKSHAPEMQHALFNHLISCGKETKYGAEKHFSAIKDFEDFRKKVPLCRYNDFVPYIERLRRGEDYVLWNQKVRWFAKSSGTSSDKSKYIPITPDSLYINHFGGMKRMLFNYVSLHPDSLLFSTKALTLGGSVQPDSLAQNGLNIFNGDLSAVMLKNSPKLAELVRTPSRETALIAEFEKKVMQICKECTTQNVSNFSGVPSWNLVLMNKVLEYTQKSNLLEVWPHLELFMHGGISFAPYREAYKKLIPSDKMHYLENYNASEGYFAFQDEFPNNPLADSEQAQMLLTVNNGIFYEFIPFKEMTGNNEVDALKSVPLEGVKTGIDYAIVITTCGGLWRYMPEDCVRFTSVNPYRIIVSGRTKLYINAFGEELMIDNAERALQNTCRKFNLQVTDFTVAPEFMGIAAGAGAGSGSGSGTSGSCSSGATSGSAGSNGSSTATANSLSSSASGQDTLHRFTLQQGCHVWAIEFSDSQHNPGSPTFDPAAVEEFAEVLDRELTTINSDYEAKRSPGSTMQRLKILPLAPGTFLKWMQQRGKLGGQNKVPRLWKDQTFINQLKDIKL